MSQVAEVTAPAITQEAWESAVAGDDKIQDDYGREWEILQNIGEEPMGHVLSAQCPGHHPKRLMLSGMHGHLQILSCDDYLPIPELNTGNVRLISA